MLGQLQDLRWCNLWTYVGATSGPMLVQPLQSLTAKKYARTETTMFSGLLLAQKLLSVRFASLLGLQCRLYTLVCVRALRLLAKLIKPKSLEKEVGQFNCWHMKCTVFHLSKLYKAGTLLGNSVNPTFPFPTLTSLVCLLLTPQKNRFLEIYALELTVLKIQYSLYRTMAGCIPVRCSFRDHYSKEIFRPGFPQMMRQFCLLHWEEIITKIWSP